MKHIFFLLLLGFTFNLNAQNTLKGSVTDSISGSTIFGAKINIKEIGLGAISNPDGSFELNNIPDGNWTIAVTAISYLPREFSLSFPFSRDGEFVIRLIPEEITLDEIIVEATRANKSVSDLPTRTEVLTDEIDEAASMEPSKISHLITHSTGIQVQTTSASSNGAVVRIQGLNGRYTQLLKDGFPLYGGFSGSLDVMQIAPLDLRQVEFVKGPASTLYGGGAIAGLINLISKVPDSDETLLHFNYSHIGGRDMNAFVSKRTGKFGFTNLATYHQQNPYDPDADSYADLPEVRKFNFNPRLYFYIDKKTKLYLGANVSSENRNGGDMQLIDGNTADSVHFFSDRQKSERFTTQFLAAREFGQNSSLTLKNSVSSFTRDIQITKNSLGELTRFAGKQLNTFSELNYLYKKTGNVLNIGFNMYTDEFWEETTSVAELRNQSYLTAGMFVNDLWDISKKFAVESGIRGDYVQARSAVSYNTGEFFALPRLSLLYKVFRGFSLRAGGGMGYRMPTIFNEESEPFAYENIRAIDFENVKPERSTGGNFDIKYTTNFGTENLLLSLNQVFFYNLISNPIGLSADTSGNLFYSNVNGLLHSRGFESQIKFTFWKFTWFFGYTYSEAYIEDGATMDFLTLTPKHSIKGDLLFVSENKWRIGWDYEYKSEQLLSNGLMTPALFTTGVVAERTIGNFVIFLNAENFTDVRQSKYESLLSGPNNTSQFTEVWAPLDGFFFNAGLKIKL